MTIDQCMSVLYPVTGTATRGIRFYGLLHLHLWQVDVFQSADLRHVSQIKVNNSNESEEFHVENINQIHKSESSFVTRIFKKQTT